MSEPKMTPEPLGTKDSLNGNAPLKDFQASLVPIEWPSQVDVLREAKSYPGNMAKGILALIPEAWADGWWGFQTFRVQKFAPDWKAQMRWHFERDWVNGNPQARGLAAPGANGHSVWNLTQALGQLKQRAAEHPANEASSGYVTDCSDEERADFDRLQDQIRRTEQQISNSGTLPPAA